MSKAVVTCALTGVLTDPAQHHVPVTPEQMAREARAAFDAGASVMHVHFRQQAPGKGHLPTWDPAVAGEIAQTIRESCPGVIFNQSTGVVGPDIAGPVACIRAIRPEIAACNAGSLNYLKVKSDGSWWGSLAMGVGLIVAPPLAERTGKIQLVVTTQALSIPFLILLGFSPIFWIGATTYYIRLALMNMSSPVYQTFVMEHVDPSALATVASLTSMAWNFGWAFSPTISGWLQVRYGFGPPFIGTIALYTISVFMYWAFFWRGKVEPLPAPTV